MPWMIPRPMLWHVSTPFRLFLKQFFVYLRGMHQLKSRSSWLDSSYPSTMCQNYVFIYPSVCKGNLRTSGQTPQWTSANHVIVRFFSSVCLWRQIEFDALALYPAITRTFSTTPQFLFQGANVKSSMMHQSLLRYVGPPQPLQIGWRKFRTSTFSPASLCWISPKNVKAEGWKLEDKQSL